MSSLIQGYEYDIFISYRQNDNKRDGWVTEFVNTLKDELDATLKNKISLYFDENPQDGLLETHNVDKSLERKLKCLIFIPIVSQTYCDPKCFAWQHELSPFVDLASQDAIGMNVQLANGNVASRILPIKIHDIDTADEELLQERTGSIVRSIDFIYQGKGVNRPLSINESQDDNTRNLNYKNQINKVANAVKELVEGASAVKHAVDSLVEEIIDNEETKPNYSFGEKVKQRDLLKVGLVYTIFSLVLWKAIDLAVVFFSWSSVIVDIAAIGLIAILPVALLFAWLFERGPSGFIMTSSLEAKNNPFTGKQKKPLTSNTAILALLVVMLVLYFVPQTILPNIPTSRANLLKNKSIAVLYFDNMSGDPEQEYFSDGITEEIIARLTKIEGIRVISRTSTRVYKGQPINLKKIAKELNVSAVLEGSFRKVGNQIKVTAQLINAETDEHIWAETYERELKDIFQVQSDIAHEIAEKFELEVAAEIEFKIEKQITSNTEAYDYYLRARHIAFNEYYYNFDSIDFERSRLMYEKAILLDPSFAEAYAGLADLYDAYRGGDLDNFSEQMDSTRHALSWKAYLLDSNSAFVHNVRVWMLLNREKPLEDSAFYHAKRALQLDPNDYYNYETIGEVIGEHPGSLELAKPYFQKALNLNPMSAQLNSKLGHYYWLNGDFGNAKFHFEKAYELEQYKNYVGWGWTVFWLLSHSKVEEGKQLLSNQETKGAFWKASVDLFEGKHQKAIAHTDSLQNSWWLKAEFNAIADNKEKAFSALIKQTESDQTSYLWISNTESWQKYQKDTTFKKILEAHKKIYERRKDSTFHKFETKLLDLEISKLE